MVESCFQLASCLGGVAALVLAAISIRVMVNPTRYWTPPFALLTGSGGLVASALGAMAGGLAFRREDPALAVQRAGYVWLVSISMIVTTIVASYTSHVWSVVFQLPPHERSIESTLTGGFVATMWILDAAMLLQLLSAWCCYPIHRQPIVRFGETRDRSDVARTLQSESSMPHRRSSSSPAAVLAEPRRKRSSSASRRVSGGT